MIGPQAAAARWSRGRAAEPKARPGPVSPQNRARPLGLPDPMADDDAEATEDGVDRIHNVDRPAGSRRGVAVHYKGPTGPPRPAPITGRCLYAGHSKKL